MEHSSRKRTAEAARMELSQCLSDSGSECEQGDTVDRVPAGSSKCFLKKRLMDKNVYQVDSKLNSKSLSLLTGGFDEGDEDDRMLAGMDYFKEISQIEKEYLNAAKLQSVSSGSVEKYFANSELVYRFGTGTALKCRLGFCEFSSMWKIYLYKRNLNFKPSIIAISFIEMNQFKSLLETILKEIEHGNANGKPYLKPLAADVEHWKPEKPDSPGFWTKNDVMCLESGTLRIRVIWNFGSSYSIYINNPKTSEKYEGFCGPRIGMNAAETHTLIRILKEINEKCPTYEAMLDFVDKNQ